MPSAEAQAVFDEAQRIEPGNPAHAVALYKKSVKMNNGFAAKRLGDIFGKGLPGIPRDYAESLHWWRVANQLGANAPQGCEGTR